MPQMLFSVKISYINQMADMCRAVEANGMMWPKVWGWFGGLALNFFIPAGYGGSCFPKDTLALVKTGEAQTLICQL